MTARLTFTFLSATSSRSVLSLFRLSLAAQPRAGHSSPAWRDVGEYCRDCRGREWKLCRTLVEGEEFGQSLTLLCHSLGHTLEDVADHRWMGWR